MPSRKVIIPLGVILLIILGGGVGWWTHRQTTSPSGATPVVVVPTPSQEPVVAGSYPATPLPHESERLIIPAISLSAYIQRVEVNKQGEIGVPTNINLAGWFTGSVVPGEKGLSIIDGHVNRTKTAGVFANLTKLKSDDEIQVQLANGKKYYFSVMKVITVESSQAANQLFSQDPTVSSQLNLITCDGAYDAKKEDFSERTIVQAKLR